MPEPERETTNAHQKLWEAIGCLAVGTGSIQSRLSDACLSLVMLTDDEFTGEDERALWRKIRSAIASRNHGGTMGALEATIREMDDETAVAVARDIMALCEQS